MTEHDIRFVPITDIQPNSFNPWRYIAGLFDAEGTFRIYRIHYDKKRSRGAGPYGYYAEIRIEVVNHEVLEWFYNYLKGFGIQAYLYSYSPRKPAHRQTTLLKLSSMRDILKCLEYMEPFCITKSKHAAELMKFLQRRIEQNRKPQSDYSIEIDCEKEMRSLNRKGNQDTGSLPEKKLSWEWLAGIIDGDGCISFGIGRNRKHGSKIILPKIVIDMTCGDTMNAIYTFLSSRGIKVGLYHYPGRKKQHSVSYRIGIARRDALNQVLPEILPFLRILKNQALMLTEYFHRRFDKSVKYCARDFELVDKIRVLNQRGVFVETKTKKVELPVELIGESELNFNVRPDFKINQLTDPEKIKHDKFCALQEDFTKNHLEEAISDLIAFAAKHLDNKIKTGTSAVL